ncbi:MAG: penicillin-binding transpeptidase domain-containing protein, partial [Candidatus Pacearchaeota archaeon]|nr:penicillin-binding transpeptidase domain-containing protein [Candidatus Pacearchaeota archaeon]
TISDLADQNKALGAHNAALAAVDPNTGEILVMVGSRDWFGNSEPAGCTSGLSCLFDPKVNVATSLPGRQPGSAFKPFVYATAFKKGFDDNTVVIDEETNFGVWGDQEYIPRNYDGTFRGPVTLRQALAQSLNIPSIKVLLDFAGIQDSIDTARAMGITTLQDAFAYGPSLVLGGGEVRLLDMTSAYGVFAAGGKRIPPYSIKRIESSDGRVLKETRKTPIIVLDPKVAEMITSILSDNAARIPVFIENSSLNIPGVAAKTGTTQESKDAWVMGYTKNISVGVWVGNSDAEPANENPSVILGGPIWNRFMRSAVELRGLTP